MRVSELKEGMLIRPKKGCRFRQFKSQWAGSPDYTQLECHARRSPYPIVPSSPVVYLGKVPRTELGKQSQYEARHAVYVTALGVRMRVAPEAWRNMEPVPHD